MSACISRPERPKCVKDKVKRPRIGPRLLALKYFLVHIHNLYVNAANVNASLIWACALIANKVWSFNCRLSYSYVSPEYSMHHRTLQIGDYSHQYASV